MKIDALICLGANDNQLPLIKAAKAKGYQVVGIDRNPMAVGFGFVDEKIIESTYESDKVIDHLLKLETKYDFKGLLARCSGPALNTAAAIVEKFNLPGPTKELIPLATEKATLRKFCELHQLPMPKGQKIKKVEEFEYSLDFPLIIKPDLPIVGKKNIKVIENRTNFEAAIIAAKQASGNDFVEVEEYIEGFDVAYLFQIKNGQAKIVAYWDELVGIASKGSIQGLGVSIPSIIKETESDSEVQIIIDKLATYFSQTNALLVLSLRISQEGKPYIIELHADLGGDLIGDILLPQSNKSFNYFDMVIDFALDRDMATHQSDFGPTTLIYNSGENKVIQEKTLLENLKIADSILAVSKIPLPIKYLKQKMNSTKSILFLGGGELALPMLQWAKDIGFHVIVNDKNSTAPGIKIADLVINFDSTDIRGLTTWVCKNKNLNIKYCYCGSDFGLLTATLIHQVLGLTHSPLESILNSLDKSLMKQCWENTGINYPKSLTVDSVEKAISAGDELGWPIVIKPSSASGSQGVKYAANSEEAKLAVLEALIYCNSILVEKFIQGSHHDINGLFWNGQFYPCGIADRFFTPPPYFVAHHGYFPSVLTKDIYNELYDLVEKGARSLGISHGPIKGDCVIKNGQAYVYEISPRFHGDILSTRSMGFLKEKNPVYQLLQKIYNEDNYQFLPVESTNQVGAWRVGLDNLDCIDKTMIQGIFYKNLNQQKPETVKNNDQIAGLAWVWTKNHLEAKNYLNLEEYNNKEKVTQTIQTDIINKENLNSMAQKEFNIGEYLKENKDYPRTIYVEVTPHCNLRCSICPCFFPGNEVYNYRKNMFMSFLDFKSIIDKIKGKFNFQICFTYSGEPLLNENIYKIIEYLTENNIPSSLYTNAMLMDEESSKKLIAAGVDRITVSFDGATKETYETIRVNAKFDQVVENIKFLVNHRNSLKLKSPQVRLQMIITKKNAHEKDLFRQLTKDLQVDDAYFKTLALNFVEMDKNGEKGQQIKEEYFQEGELARYEQDANGKLSLKDKEGCPEIQNTVITSDGDVVSCCFDLFGKYNFGNAKNESLATIWDSQKFKDFRENIMNKRGVPICELCNSSKQISDKV